MATGIIKVDYGSITGGGEDMSPLFGINVAFMTTETVEYPVCPVIGVKHVDVVRYGGTGGVTLYGTDKGGTKTQIYSGTGTTNLDVSGYILLSGIRGSGNATSFYIKYVD